MGEISVIRSLSSMLSRIRAIAPTMFAGKRDFYEALGYNSTLTYEDHRTRYDRGDIAGRIVDAFPEATWGGEAEIIEDETPEVLTPFEAAISELLSRTRLWSVLQRADCLAGVGEYSVVLIGGPGPLEEELPRGRKATDIRYFSTYAQGNARISKYDEDQQSERYGFPTEYELINLKAGGVVSQTGMSRKVHWTRVVHVADNVLDNELIGRPRLTRVWNRLDDLEKVVGGGSEAFWKTVFQGMQIDVDKEMDLSPEAKTELQEQVDEFEHGMRRIFRTRGVKVNSLGADTSDFSPQASTLLDLIAGTTTIPKRILLGSERGELASTQDRENWHDRVRNRRAQFAAPFVVHPIVDRLIQYGYLPTPRASYWVVWPKLGLTLTEGSLVLERLSKVNAAMGETVVTGPDLRDQILGWDPLDPSLVDTASELDAPEDENTEEEAEDPPA